MKLRDVKTWKPVEQVFFGIAFGLWVYVLLGWATIVYRVWSAAR